MKIMISHIPNTFNYGSAMMAINLIYYLNKKIRGDVSFFVDTRTNEDLQNLIKSTGLKNIEVNKVLPDKKAFVAGKNVSMDLNWIGAYCDGIINYYDCFIVLGGDDLSEYYSKEQLVYELFKINRIATKIPVFLIGQTIGPFTAWRKGYAADMLKTTRIFARDYLTVKYLKSELGFENITKSSDLAFLKLPGQDDYNVESILNKYNLLKNNYITMIPSGLVRCYTDNYKKYIENLIRIIEYIITKRQIKIVLMPHVLWPEASNDKPIIEEIMKQIGGIYSEKLISIDDILLPLDARVILGNGIISIAGRMHGAISTFQMGKPAISLSYSVKYQGVIGEGLECQDLIVEASDYKKWEYGEIALETINKVEYLLNNYMAFVSRIRSKVALCKNEVFQMIDQVYSEMAGL